MSKAGANIFRSNPPKKSSQGGNHSMIKTSSMSKSRRRSYKKYRGQGKR